MIIKYLVPRIGIEPALPCHNQILSISRLRIPPSGQFTPECSAQVILTTLFQLSVCYNFKPCHRKQYKRLQKRATKGIKKLRFRKISEFLWLLTS